MTEYQILKQQILKPSVDSKNGNSELENRAKKNRLKVKSGEDLEDELKLLIKLKDDLLEFDSQAITRLCSFILNSEIKDSKIAESYLNFIKNSTEEMSYYQKASLLNYISKVIPESPMLNTDIISYELAEVKNYDPWLYLQILSNVSVSEAIKFLSYLIKSGKNNNALVNNLILKWLKNDKLNLTLAKELYMILPKTHRLRKKLHSNFQIKERTKIVRTSVLSGSNEFKAFKSQRSRQRVKKRELIFAN